LKKIAVLLLATGLLAADLGEIRSVLVNRVDLAKKTVGIVVGTIDPKGRQVIGYGHVADSASPPPDGDTLFEIGSISKVFTSLVLADMIERGEVKPDDPVAKYLPATVKMPSRNGRQITLLDISMQISGLPRMPNNMKPADFANPYADYDPPKLYEFLSGYTLTRDIGEKYEYSNLAVGLLGHALSLKAGMTYEQMIRKRILEPLGMNSTTVTLSAEQQKRMAAGHDATLKQVKLWDLDALAGAGAIRSSANDMLKFLAANLELTDTPLKAAMRRMRSVHRETGVPDLEIMMAWHVVHKYGTDLVWHNGGTAGFRTFAGFDPAKKTGAVVLCNTFTDCDDIGRHMIESQWPVAQFTPPVTHKETSLDPKILETYVGTYPLGPNFSIAITRDEGRLFAQATSQPKFELFAEKEGEFFFKVVDAQITFTRNESGAVTGLILHQNGLDQKAPRTP
jgi:serine-type D-Ala-D-Ala carboxypeptidase/endopeptidase